MSLNGQVHGNAQHLELVGNGAGGALTIPVEATYTTTPVTALSGMRYLSAEAQFVRAAGGTTLDVYIQTSMDGQLSWVDIIQFSFATTTASKASAVSASVAPAAQGFTPGDGALSANTVIQGFLGGSLRVKYVVVGTYTGASTIRVDAFAKG